MQLTLFSGAGEGALFQKSSLKRYLAEHRTTEIVNESNRVSILSNWLAALNQPSSVKKETSIEHTFVQDIICEILGYKLYPPQPNCIATAWIKPPSSITGIGKEPDLAFGKFASEGENSFFAIGELKRPGTQFDMPQPRKDPKTPVEQGFEYGKSILGVRWVLVTDMRIIRLYSVDSPGNFEKFDLEKCIDEKGNPTEEFRRLYFLLHFDYLVKDEEESPVNSLYAKNTAHQIEIRDEFYTVYYQIRSDLYHAIRNATSHFENVPNREELLEATQRLLDRLIFIYYCEDHPQALIPKNTISSVTESSRCLPGPSANKVYDSLKLLFREIDIGSYQNNIIKIDGYNGELFKDHYIIDHIDLPDSLHDHIYETNDYYNRIRLIRGVWGLHVYDYWLELNEHLLGHIFEQSLSDLSALDVTKPISIAEKLRERKQTGIFYTTDILSDFIATTAINSILDEMESADPESESELIPMFKSRLEKLKQVKIIDLACGSGAFLASSYRELLKEYWRLNEAINAVNALDGKKQELFSYFQNINQAVVLRESLFGIDLLPQAVEIAKLALWLQSARKGEKVSDLLQNIISGDSLDVEETLNQLNTSQGKFDLVIGNPPWGVEVSLPVYEKALEFLGLSKDINWDTWELFIAIGLHVLKEGGRIALLVPDSFFYPEKVRIRQLIFNNLRIEKVYNLGPDWFGSDVRMSTVFIQLCKSESEQNYDFSGLLLTGNLRTKAIKGEIPLSQIEAQRKRDIPSERCKNNNYEVEVFRSRQDDKIIEKIESRSNTLSTICDRGRGEEINKGGLLWVCPNCMRPTTPGKKTKGGGYEDKECPNCKLLMSEKDVNTISLIEGLISENSAYVPFIDGDDIKRRYQQIAISKQMRIGVSGWKYKTDSLYVKPKILIRQAGVGISATYDITSARCPQSVYIYRLKQDAVVKGYDHEFILASLLSRAMAYYIFKRFAEVDPAKAHAKLTHERLSGLPIPNIDFKDNNTLQIYNSIIENSKALLEGSAKIGGEEDLQIEINLRKLWGISPEEGAYINGEFADLPSSQNVHDLFPNGIPKVKKLS